LRLLDANANRAREALRVLEDYARFVLDNPEISGALKQIRHELTTALTDILPQAIAHRDTAGDVGTTIKTPEELNRADLADVVAANGKRLGEALRAIEEFAKINWPANAARVEKLRYTFYDVEARLNLTLARGGRFAGVRLYVLITESVCRIPWLDAARAAIAGGADCLQLREKNLDGGEFLRRAKVLAEECHKANRLLIVNDRPDVAMLSEADGVHVGQRDLPAAEVRKMVGPHMIVGVSTHSVEQARQAVRDGADYVGIGPVFVSGTKPRDFRVGLEGAAAVSKAVEIPVVAIAGISLANVDDVWATGVQAVAVTAAVLDTEDVQAATKALKDRLTLARKGHGCPVSP
jgi:thiamine-phosphate pyrophosphorylase